MLFKCSILLVLISLSFIKVESAIDTEIENKNVDRTIDLASQLVKISYKITLDHKSKKPINSYTFVVPESDRKHLAYISAKDSAKKELKLTEGTSTKEGVSFSMTLTGSTPNPVVYIETVYSKFLQPFPTQIIQSERQLVRFFGNAYFYSPYKTVAQKSTLHLSSRNVESFTQVKPSAQSDTVITYGPYENVAGKFFVFRFNRPVFLVVSLMRLTIVDRVGVSQQTFASYLSNKMYLSMALFCFHPEEFF